MKDGKSGIFSKRMKMVFEGSNLSALIQFDCVILSDNFGLLVGKAKLDCSHLPVVRGDRCSQRKNGVSSAEFGAPCLFFINTAKSPLNWGGKYPKCCNHI